MSSGPLHYCWCCYAEVPAPAGRCPNCGREIAAPVGADHVDKLIWALHHPLPERRLLAADALAQRRERRAAPVLRRSLEERPDPYQQASVLSALLAIEGVEGLGDLLARLAADGAAPARRVATQALQADPCRVPAEMAGARSSRRSADLTTGRRPGNPRGCRAAGDLTQTTP